MENYMNLCPVDYLLRPDVVEVCEVLYHCGLLKESQYQNLQILHFYDHLKLTLPSKTRQYVLIEQVKDVMHLNMEAETLRKLIERYYSPIPQSVINLLRKKYPCCV